jgi:citrate lyase beta subunit
MRKSLALQRELYDEFGACVFDVTLDCEDGAPVGAEAEHAALVAELLDGADARCRVGVRLHAVDHPAFGQDAQTIVGRAAVLGSAQPAYIMLPKVESVACVDAAVAAIDAAGGGALSVHVLLESPLAIHRAHDIAAHPRVESLSFGLMDFVSAHGGAIPSSGMGLTASLRTPLVVRAKLELASAAHAHGKVPSHCVVTEFRDQAALHAAAFKARINWATHACGAFIRTRSGRSSMCLRLTPVKLNKRFASLMQQQPTTGVPRKWMVCCMTGRATVFFGKLWSALTRLGVRYRPKWPNIFLDNDWSASC